MQAALYVAVTILAAATFGWLIALAVRSIKFRLVRWGLSLFGGSAALVVGGFFLFSRGLAVPADDNEMFGRRERLGVGIYRSASMSSPAIRLAFGFPPSVRVKDDATLDFSLEAFDIPSGTYKAALEGNRDVEVRSMQPCPASSPSVSSGMTVAGCGEVRDSERGLRFRWLIRSAQPGRALLVLHLPDEILPTNQGLPDWRANLERGGQAVTRPVAEPEEGSRSSLPGRESRPRTRRVPLILSPGDPVFSFENAEIDLRAKRLTLSIDFDTTLGVASSTYELLTMGAAVLSGLLGGGWIWQLLSWLNARRAQARATTSGD